MTDTATNSKKINAGVLVVAVYTAISIAGQGQPQTAPPKGSTANSKLVGSAMIELKTSSSVPTGVIPFEYIKDVATSNISIALDTDFHELIERLTNLFLSVNEQHFEEGVSFALCRGLFECLGI